jgi:hypothetical protein
VLIRFSVVDEFEHALTKCAEVSIDFFLVDCVGQVPNIEGFEKQRCMRQSSIVKMLYILRVSL